MAELPSPELTQSQDQQFTRAASPASQQSLSDRDSALLKTWGNFQLLQRLGRGGFGEVFRAWDPVLEREVALKLLLPRGLDLDEQFARLIAEARAIARVRHPNIVSVYGVDSREGRFGFWSDYIRGLTLSALVAARGPLCSEDAARIAITLCEALAAVHHAGLLHRDIKPGNAMRDDDGRVLLMDFGLSQDLLGSAAFGGTPGYLAPELHADQPASVQSDIYAMGVLVRFLVTGSSKPAPPQIPAAKATQSDKSLAGIIARATDPDPKLRYASAEQMATALNQAIATQSTPPSSSLLGWRNVRWLVAALAIVALILAPRLLHRPNTGVPAAGTPAVANYLAANDALLRYDKPGNTDKAIDLYQAVLKQSPAYALAEAGLARAYWRKYSDTNESKWADDATQAAARAIDMNSNLAAVQMTMGMIHIDQGKFDVGMQELQQALKDDPRSPDAHAELAEAYRQQGRIDDAKKEFQTAMDLDPDNWRWPYLLGALQIDAGDLKGAERNLNLALSKTADNARVLYNLGIVYRKQDRLAEAQKVLQASISLDQRADPTLELGQVACQRGDFEQAIGSFRKAAEMDPMDFSAWGNLAAAYQATGNHSSEAADAFHRAISLAKDQVKRTPDAPYPVSVLARYYANIHAEADALPLIRKSLALAPNDPDVLERIAEAYEALGDRANALIHIRRALDLGYSVNYARTDPALKNLRHDPKAPREIRTTP